MSLDRITAARTARAVFQGGKSEKVHDGWFGSRPNRALSGPWTGFTVFKLKPVRSEHVTATGAAILLDPAPPTSLTEASKNGNPGSLPVFGVPRKAEDAAPPKPIVVGNHRARKRQARVVFEYACSAASNMGRVFQGLGVPHVRLAKEFIVLNSDAGEVQLDAQLKSCETPKIFGPQFLAIVKAGLGMTLPHSLGNIIKPSPRSPFTGVPSV